jgi:hypothetical protein
VLYDVRVALPNGGSLGVVIFSAVVEITVSLNVDLRHGIDCIQKSREIACCLSAYAVASSVMSDEAHHEAMKPSSSTIISQPGCSCRKECHLSMS